MEAWERVIDATALEDSDLFVPKTDLEQNEENKKEDIPVVPKNEDSAIS